MDRPLRILAVDDEPNLLQIFRINLSQEGYAVDIATNVQGEKLDLTKTEFDILALLARNAGKVVSKQQLLTEVWGSPHFTANVVEVHVSSLRKKLEAIDGSNQPIETVRGAGYVLRG